jgi:hypothetical protein
MFLVAFSAVMIGVALTFLEGFIAGGFVGLWFVILIFSGAQVMLVDRQSVTSEDRQIEFRQQLAKTRPVRKKRREIL